MKNESAFNNFNKKFEFYLYKNYLNNDFNKIKKLSLVERFRERFNIRKYLEGEITFEKMTKTRVILVSFFLMNLTNIFDLQKIHLMKVLQKEGNITASFSYLISQRYKESIEGSYTLMKSIFSTYFRHNFNFPNIIYSNLVYGLSYVYLLYNWKNLNSFEDYSKVLFVNALSFPIVYLQKKSIVDFLFKKGHINENFLNKFALNFYFIECLFLPFTFIKLSDILHELILMDSTPYLGIEQQVNKLKQDLRVQAPRVDRSALFQPVIEKRIEKDSLHIAAVSYLAGVALTAIISPIQFVLYQISLKEKISFRDIEWNKAQLKGIVKLNLINFVIRYGNVYALFKYYNY